MKKRWLTAIIMAALLLVQAVVICGGALAEGEEHEHVWSAWKSYATGHKRSCTVEGCKEVQEGDHVAPCEICGYGMPEHTHEWSEWEGHGTYHERHCTAEGCDEVEKVDHDVPCEICGDGMHKHAKSEEWDWDDLDHWHYCTVDGCSAITDVGAHEMEDDENGGAKCKVCDYTRDHKEHEFSDDWAKNDVGHWRVCTIDGCDAITDAAIHEMEDDENGGAKCKVCGYTRDHKEHDFSGDWIKDDVDHWHVCTIDGCNAVDEYISHTMIPNAENNGFVCSVCGYECAHKKHIAGKWDFDGKGHWMVCAVEGCNAIDPYSFSKHRLEDDDNGGVRCKICGYTRDHKEHQWSAWESKGTYHERHCTAEGCDGVEKASHDIPCEICGDGMPEHTHEWSEWEGHGTYHERHCTAEGCDGVEKANHDVPCATCGYGVHTHEWSAWEGHGTYHERHCTAEDCDEVEKVDHDVPCTICGYGVQLEHTFSDEWSYDEVDHWHACTEEGCNWTKDQAEHEWSEWEGHGTYHERHCTVCPKTEREDHELTDGRCDKCGYTMHGAKNEWKYDETNHWHECLFEGCTEKFGEEAHTLVNGKCACGYEKKQEEKPAEPSYDYDNEYVVPTPLPPQTGDASWLAVGIGMIAAAACIALRKKQSN